MYLFKSRPAASGIVTSKSKLMMVAKKAKCRINYRVDEKKWKRECKIYFQIE